MSASALAGLIVILSMLSLVATLFYSFRAIFFREQRRALLRRSLLLFGFSFGGLVVAALIAPPPAGTPTDQALRKQAADTAAAAANRADETAATAALAAETARLTEERAAAAKAEADAKANAVAALEAECRDDLQCWSDRNLGKATVACKDAIERLAKFDIRWTNSFLEPIFSKVGWADMSAGIVNYVGDVVQFQNGFGAWQPHSYVCSYDPSGTTPTKAGASPGRL